MRAFSPTAKRAALTEPARPHVSGAGARHNLLEQAIAWMRGPLTIRRHRASIGLCGPVGEYEGLIAGISFSDKDGRPARLAARGGVGAVMGSKKVKAIVVDLDKIPPFNEPRKVNAAIKDYAVNFDTLTPAKATELTDRALALEERRLALVKRTLGQVRSALPAPKAARWYQVEMALNKAVDLLVDMAGMDFYDAGRLLSFAGNLMISQYVPPVVIHCRVDMPKSLLAQLGFDLRRAVGAP